MESHVSGGITPLNIGELRQAILAVLVGNPLFTEEEQLLANHLIYECEDIERLALWLRNVRIQDTKRSRFTRALAALDSNPQVVCSGEAVHMAEMESLLQCRALSEWQKSLFLSLMVGAGGSANSRREWIGQIYLMLLENLGRIPKSTGFRALKDN